MHKVHRNIQQEMTPERIVFLADKIKDIEKGLRIHHRRMTDKNIRQKGIQTIYKEFSIWKSFNITMVEFQLTISQVLSEIPNEMINLFGEREPLKKTSKDETFTEWQSRTPFREQWLNGDIRGTFDH